MSPVVVRGDGSTRADQFEGRITQASGNRHPLHVERRPDGAHDDLLRLCAGNNEAADDHVVAGLRSHPSREVDGPRCWSRNWCRGWRRGGGWGRARAWCWSCAWCRGRSWVVGVGVGVGPTSQAVGPIIATVIGDPVLKKPIVAFVACGGRSESKRKLYERAKTNRVRVLVLRKGL